MRLAIGNNQLLPPALDTRELHRVAKVSQQPRYAFQHALLRGRIRREWPNSLHGSPRLFFIHIAPAAGETKGKALRVQRGVFAVRPRSPGLTCRFHRLGYPPLSSKLKTGVVMAGSSQDSRARLLAVLRVVALNSLTGLLVGLGGQFYSLYQEIKAPFFAHVLPEVSNSTLWQTLLLTLSLLLLVTCTLLYLLWDKPKKLTLKYGIEWDGDLNPHCPCCRTPLAGFGLRSTFSQGYADRKNQDFSGWCGLCKDNITAESESTAHFNSVQELKDSLR